MGLVFGHAFLHVVQYERQEDNATVMVSQHFNVVIFWQLGRFNKPLRTDRGNHIIELPAVDPSPLGIEAMG